MSSLRSGVAEVAVYESGLRALQNVNRGAGAGGAGRSSSSSPVVRTDVKEKLISSWHFLTTLIRMVLEEEESSSEEGDSSKDDPAPSVVAAKNKDLSPGMRIGLGLPSGSTSASSQSADTESLASLSTT